MLQKNGGQAQGREIFSAEGYFDATADMFRAMTRGVVLDANVQAALRWQARNEKGVYGYLVFRAEKPEGPFLRISREIIHSRPAGQDEAEVSSYQFVDADVAGGQTYYYTLDLVANNGQKRRFSGVIAKTVSR